MPKTPEIFSRNWAFIDKAVQEKLATSRMFVAGLGMGSVIALLAARHGFGKFTVADGDNVERSNLNRQIFSAEHVGLNKARVVAELLKSLRREIEVSSIECFVTETNVEAFVASSDIVVNTIDWGHPALFACAECCRKMGKTMLFPLNIGWGGALYIFNPQGPALRDFFDFQQGVSGQRGIVQKELIQRAYNKKPPAYIARIEHLLDQLDAADWTDPQLGAAVYLNAATVVTAAIALVAGQKVRVVPEVIYFDLFEHVSAGSL